MVIADEIWLATVGANCTTTVHHVPGAGAAADVPPVPGNVPPLKLNGDERPSGMNIDGVAVAEWQGPEAGLAELEGLAPPAWLSGSYLWDAVLGDLPRRAGHSEIARQHRERALVPAPTDAVRELLRRRLAAPD